MLSLCTHHLYSLCMRNMVQSLKLLFESLASKFFDVKGPGAEIRHGMFNTFVDRSLAQRPGEIWFGIVLIEACHFA